MLDDIAVVMQSESFDIHRFIKRPGVGSVFLCKHFPDNSGTIAQLLRDLGAAIYWDAGCWDYSGVQDRRCGKLGVRHLRFLYGPSLATTLPSLCRLGWFRVTGKRRRFMERIVGGGSRSIRFPFNPFLEWKIKRSVAE